MPAKLQGSVLCKLTLGGAFPAEKSKPPVPHTGAMPGVFSLQSV